MIMKNKKGFKIRYAWYSQRSVCPESPVPTYPYLNFIDQLEGSLHINSLNSCAVFRLTFL